MTLILLENRTTTLNLLMFSVGCDGNTVFMLIYVVATFSHHQNMTRARMYHILQLRRMITNLIILRQMLQKT